MWLDQLFLTTDPYHSLLSSGKNIPVSWQTLPPLPVFLMLQHKADKNRKGELAVTCDSCYETLWKHSWPCYYNWNVAAILGCSATQREKQRYKSDINTQTHLEQHTHLHTGTQSEYDHINRHNRPSQCAVRGHGIQSDTLQHKTIICCMCPAFVTHTLTEHNRSINCLQTLFSSSRSRLSHPETHIGAARSYTDTLQSPWRECLTQGLCCLGNTCPFFPPAFLLWSAVVIVDHCSPGVPGQPGPSSPATPPFISGLQKETSRSHRAAHFIVS